MLRLFFITLSLFLYSLPIVAKESALKLPYLQKNTVETSCGGGMPATHKGIYGNYSNKQLTLFDKPLAKKAVDVLKPGTRFETLDWHLYTIKSGPCILQFDEEFTSETEDGQRTVIKAKKGEKIYRISYVGEGSYLSWFQGEEVIYRPENPESECEGENVVEYWTQIKTKGKLYWWRSPQQCSLAFPKSWCPQFFDEKEWQEYKEQTLNQQLYN